MIILASIIATVAGGFFAIRYKDKLHLILGFSAGAILGVALFDLLPEAITLSSGTYNTVTVFLSSAIGFSFYLLLDRLFSLHSHECDHDCEKPYHKGKLGASTFLLHSFLDGFGIGLAFKISHEIGWVVAAAVLAHKFSDGVNTAGIILKNKGQKKEAYRWLFANAASPALGVLLAYYVTISDASLGLLLSLFAGLFIYISASDLIPEGHHKHPAFWTTVMTIAGIVITYLISQIR